MDSLEGVLAGLGGDYSFELLDKVRLMLREDYRQRKTAREMLRMFEQMASRRLELEEGLYRQG